MIKGYKFFPTLDSYDYDADYTNNKNINNIKTICDNSDNIAFNTVGFIKNKISEIGNLKAPSFFKNSNNGLYVKNSYLNLEHNQKIRIKLLCNWCTSETLCKEWKHMMSNPDDLQWYNLEFTWQDNNIDFYVIINKPLSNQDIYVPERTIIFHMEPWCYDPTQNWGIKSWGQWAIPDENKFLQVRSHKNFCNNAFWQLSTTYNDFKRTPIKKTKILSSICSSKYFDPGHIKRIDFLKYMDNKDELYLDIYNHDNNHKFKNYVGPHPPNFKDAGILPYKYYFMAENNIEPNFITEKIWEPIICETLCFYWGCPNISEYVDNRAYILLDLDDFEASYQIVKNAILNDEWSRRIEIIRREKQKILDYYQFFPTLERVLIHDFNMYKGISLNQINFNKYFSKTYNNLKPSSFSLFINNNDNLSKQIQYLNDNNSLYLIDNIYVLGTVLNSLNNNTFKFLDFKNKISFIQTDDCNRIVNIYKSCGAKYIHIIDDNIIHIDNKLNNLKSETLCVNLKRRPDRKDSMIQLFETNSIENYSFFEAVDGSKIELGNDDTTLFAGNDFNSNKGVIGCAKSHYNIWNNLLESDNDYYIIFEDDIQVCNDFKFKLDQIDTSGNWDIIHLGYSMYKENILANFRKYKNNDVPIKQPLNVNNYIGGTFGYLISRSGAKKLINFINNNGIKHGIDYLAKAYGNKMGLIQFEVLPHLVFSDWVNTSTGDSDIQLEQNTFNKEIFDKLANFDSKSIIKSYFPYTFNNKISNVCFIHSCFYQNTDILQSQLNLIESSGLLKNLDYIFIINLGQTLVYIHDKIKVINYSKDMSLCEKPALNLMNHFAKVYDCNILYLHTKGTHSNSPQVTDWRNMMMYFMVEQWEICLKHLKKYSVVGTNYQGSPHKHFSGNFWWTTSSYIKNKSIITSTNRHDCEWYILQDTESHFSMHNSNIDHYQQLYPRNMYLKN